MVELQELKQKIQKEISKAMEENNEQKRTLSFLFNKFEEVKELENIEQLKELDQENGTNYLKAFLTYKSISRGNYQSELIKKVSFWDGSEKLIQAINGDLDLFIEDNEVKPIEPSNYELIELLDERRRKGEIELDCSHDKDGVWYSIRERAEMSKEEAETLADQFLKRHGVCKDGNGNPNFAGKVMGDLEKTLKKVRDIKKGEK